MFHFFARIFRFRVRHRAPKADTSLASPSPQSIPSRLGFIDTPSTSRPPPVLTSEPAETAIQGSPVLVRQDRATLSPLHIPAPSHHGRLQLDGELLSNSPPVRTDLGTRQISFQLPLPGEDTPETPPSRSPTLIVTDEVEYKAGSAVLPRLTITPVSDAAASDDGLNDGPRPNSGKVRPVTLLAPQPVRMDKGRFSMPAHMVSRTRVRENKRVSLMPVGSGSGPARKAKRQSRWSREMNKPEMQEVLRTLCEI